MTSPKTATGVHVWLVLMKAHRSLGRHATRSLAPFELGASEFATLELLLNKGPQQVNEIGRRINLTSGAITSAIDRLEARGLAAREQDGTDRRGRLVRLTPSGRAYIKDVFAAHVRAMEEASVGLSKEERRTLVALLKKVGMAAEAAVPASSPERATD